jgi:hypothetical protein
VNLPQFDPLLFDLPLLPHPQRPHPSGVELRVQGHWLGQTLRLRYQLQGPGTEAIRWPATQPPGPADGLWQHTCFEAFVGSAALDAYQEFNFSPSGQWAHYHFAAERVRDPGAERATIGAVPVAVGGRTTPQHVWLDAAIDTTHWPQHPEGWTLGLSAVLETTQDVTSHWALHHLQPQPDFHHPAARAWRLRRPSL